LESDESSLLKHYKYWTKKILKIFLVASLLDFKTFEDPGDQPSQAGFQNMN
jgi:hypothetical protein